MNRMEKWIVVLVLAAWLAGAVTDYAQSQGGVGVGVGPLPPHAAAGDLVGLTGREPGHLDLTPVKVGAGLQVAGGVLSALTPHPAPTSRVYGEDLTPQVDGSGLVYTFSRPYVAGSEAVLVNGLRQVRDRHYRVEGFPPQGIRFLGAPPAVGDTVAVDYDTPQQ